MNNFDKIRCTLVTPIKNERDNIDRLWAAIQGQTVQPDEWIIMDNGSTDGTYAWLQEHALGSPFPVKILSLPGKTIAAMTNIAIKSAQYDVIAGCHGGTRIPSDWLENLLDPMEADPTVDVVGGVREPYGETPFEKWVASTMSDDTSKIDERVYIPATRSIAFRRSAWDRVGGFPEWLPRFGEDSLFGIRLRAAGCKFVIARGAKVGWRPKSSLNSLLKQYYLYSEADTCMGLLCFYPRLFVRPWFFIVISLASMVLLKSFLWGIGVVLILVALDLFRLRLLEYRCSVGSYMLWQWLIPIARQAGFGAGKFRRLLGQVEVPDSDIRDVQYYRELLRRSKYS